MLTGLDAAFATDAGIGLCDVDMLVYPEVDFAEYLLRADLDALPAGFAMPGDDCDVVSL